MQMKRWIVAIGAFSLIAVFAAAAFSYDARVDGVSGVVEYQTPGTDGWVAAAKDDKLAEGTKIRTGSGAQARVVLPDKSRTEIGPSAQIDITELKPEGNRFFLKVGKMFARVFKSKTRQRFEVKTPSALCAVRGTEFGVEVNQGGQTLLEVHEGVVGAVSSSGQELLVAAGQRLGVTADGQIGTPEGFQTNQEVRSDARQEVSADMTKEQVQAAAAQELKMAEYQSGKTMIDVSGNRVRLEEYVVRPAENQFKFVVLNERASRFDYMFFLGTFNTALPADMSVALRQMWGRFSTPPDYYLTKYETGRSNTVDNIQEIALDGHLVEDSEGITAKYDPATDTFVDVTAADKYYKVVFDKYYYNVFGSNGLYGTNLNSVSAGVYKNYAKIYYEGSNLQKESEAVWNYPGGSPATTLTIDADKIHEQLKVDYRDGTWETWDQYLISDEGKIAPASAFNAITTASGFKKELLKWNFEQVIKNSQFQGPEGKIDIVVEPKLLLQAGLLK